MKKQTNKKVEAKEGKALMNFVQQDWCIGGLQPSVKKSAVPVRIYRQIWSFWNWNYASLRGNTCFICLNKSSLWVNIIVYAKGLSNVAHIMLRMVQDRDTLIWWDYMPYLFKDFSFSRRRWKWGLCNKEYYRNQQRHWHQLISLFQKINLQGSRNTLIV